MGRGTRCWGGKRGTRCLTSKAKGGHRQVLYEAEALVWPGSLHCPWQQGKGPPWRRALQTQGTAGRFLPWEVVSPQRSCHPVNGDSPNSCPDAGAQPSVELPGAPTSVPTAHVLAVPRTPDRQLQPCPCCPLSQWVGLGLRWKNQREEAVLLNGMHAPGPCCHGFVTTLGD